MSYASMIHDARVNAGLTVSAFARRAGTSRAAISAYENERKVPTVPTLERLLAAAGFRVAIEPISNEDISPRAVRRYLHTRDRLALAVRQERAALGLSVQTLARRANVTADFVVTLEAGHADPDIAGVRRVLDALGVQALALPFDLIAGPG